MLDPSTASSQAFVSVPVFKAISIAASVVASKATEAAFKPVFDSILVATMTSEPFVQDVSMIDPFVTRKLKVPGALACTSLGHEVDCTVSGRYRMDYRNHTLPQVYRTSSCIDPL